MVITFVWQYLEEQEDFDELRYSIRSVQENVRGEKRIIVIGDRPSWYTGEFIKCPRITHSERKFMRRWHPYIDHTKKLETLCKKIDGHFIRMYDDTFVTHPVDARWFFIARYDGDIPNGSSTYKKCCMRTREDLKSRGLPIRHFGTHCPHPMDAKSVLEVIEKFQLYKRPRVIESIYHNYFPTEQEPYKPGEFKYRLNPGKFPEGFQVVNLGRVTGDDQDHLMAAFPDSSGLESEESLEYAGKRQSAVPSLTRVDCPEDCRVITATNMNYLKGAYILAWTLFRANKVNMTCYGINLDMDNGMVHQMMDWGVDFKQIEGPIPNNVFYAPTWNKPFFILDALKHDRRIMWIDADACVGDDISKFFSLLEQKPCAADHSSIGNLVRNKPSVWRLFGYPKNVWDRGKTPCAGILGFLQGRDELFIEEWLERCQRAVKMPGLWHPLHRSMNSCSLKFFDQGLMMDMWEWKPLDGIEWNFIKRGEVNGQRFMKQIYHGPQRITHFGGPKPWLQWPAVLNWGQPYGN